MKELNTYTQEKITEYLSDIEFVGSIIKLGNLYSMAVENLKEVSEFISHHYEEEYATQLKEIEDGYVLQIEVEVFNHFEGSSIYIPCADTLDGTLQYLRDLEDTLKNKIISLLK